MQPSKQTEKEVLQVYDSWLKSYLHGDVETYDSYFDDDYHFIGSTGNEEFLSRKATTKFFEETAEQFAGKCDLRKETLILEQFGELVFITHIFDAWFLHGTEYSYYGRFRFSNILHKTKEGWRFIYQHFSTPDSKTGEGETIGFDKVHAENQELREAIKRRTIELEQKNRELEIEAGLERVRASSMSMHKSDEIHRVIFIVAEQIAALGIYYDSAHFIEIHEDGSLEMWVATHGQFYAPRIHVPYANTPLMNQLRDAKKDGIEMLKSVFSLEEKNSFFNHFFGKTVAKSTPVERKEFVFQSKGLALTSFPSKSLSLSITNYQGKSYSKEENEIFKRFSDVFDQAYTRFLDLQKAEAQAREAQIEAALERVRASMMAMHHSQGLPEVMKIIAEQLIHLGIPMDAATFSPMDDSKDLNFWSATTEHTYPLQAMTPYIDHALFNWIYEAKTKRYDFVTIVLNKEECDAWWNHFFTNTNLGALIPEHRKEYIRSTNGYASSLALGKTSTLNVVNYAGIPFSDEENSILKRFAKVFDQSYTRFLDLQKAEAQVKEAKIEAALEKIRSRSLAMHKTDELGEVITVVFEKLRELDISVDDGVALITYTEDSKDLVEWMENPGFPSAIKFHLPYFEHPVLSDLWKAKDDRKDFLVTKYTAEENLSFLNHIFEHSDFKHTPQEVKEYCLAADSYGYTIAFQKNTSIFINDYSGKLLSETEIEILKRFSKVFEQAYIRFLDLQKAEAQAREAKIEASLERVRAQAMAMHHSDDLGKTIQVYYEQLDELIDSTMVRCGAGLLNKENTIAEMSTSSKSIEGETYHVKGSIDMRRHPMLENTYEHWLKQKEYSHVLHGKEIREYYQYVTNQVAIPENSEGDELYFYFPMFSEGSFYMVTNNAVPEEELHIFRRFSSVLSLTYKRFNDLQKAEAQAREAQIQLALERVRARTMAMQKSDELMDTASIMFQQLLSLEIKNTACTFVLLDPESPAGDNYSVANGQLMPFKVTLRYDLTEGLKKIYQAWKEGKEFYTADISGIEMTEVNLAIGMYLQETYGGEILTKIMEFNSQNIQNQVTDRMVTHHAYFSQGMIVVGYHEPIQEAEILKRFAAVFEQTYTRFLDLQKAEAQAREAQIEAALERVRARTMAMQHSNELGEAASLLFKQVSDLGIHTWTSGFNIWQDDGNSFIGYNPTPSGGIAAPYIIPSGEDDFFKKIYQAKKAGKDFIVFEWKEKPLAETYSYMKTLPVLQDVLKGIEDSGFQLPTFQINHCVFFAQGFLLFITLEPFQQAYDIFKRFGKVFEQTYTRFLDLQNAEAQATEAQIETAMERIRARAMAMHTSRELIEVAYVLREQMGLLNQPDLETSAVLIYHNDLESWDSWYAFRPTRDEKGSIRNGTAIFSKNDCVLTREIVQHFRSPVTEYTLEVSGKKREEWLGVLMKVAPEIAENAITDETVNYDTTYFHFSDFQGGSLLVVSYIPPSTQIKSLQRRAASVFDLAYRRFRDLQKAEAQAREAKIEAALEKVRSRTMGMQSSEELPEVANLLFTEVRALGIHAWSCGYNILAEDKKSAACIMSSEGTLQTPFQLRLWGEASFDEMGAFVLSNNTMLVQELGGTALEEHYAHMKSFPDLKPTFDEIDRLGLSLPTYQINHLCKFTQGFLLFITYEKVPDAFDIFKRFTTVFDQTYTRFLDLKKAEAQAREAIKRASVDRVRAEIASMRTTSDLERIQPLIWNELKILGVPFIRCGVFIMDEAKQEVQAFLSTPDGASIAAFRLPYHATEQTNQIVSHWQQKQSYKDHMDEAAFAEFTRNLVEQGAMASTEKYVTADRPKDLYLHFLPFLQGMLYVGNDAPLKDEELQLVQNLAEAFSTAYARYEDFVRLEQAKAEVESAMSELKATQSQLVQQEKLASLGQLTAGIAHEIQNPLNFVNNFSEVSIEFVDETIEEVEAVKTRHALSQQHALSQDNDSLNDIGNLLGDIKSNLEKINHHGQRAATIVKSMLQHSRSSSGKLTPTDLNALIREYVNLSYHGMRAGKDPINVSIELDLEENIGQIPLIIEDFSRVIVNICNNAFDAMRSVETQHAASLRVRTKKQNDFIVIEIEDNGTGIPDEIKDKILQPFFTTKKGTQGTGLGLSITHDIVKAHGGELNMETKENKGSTFTIQIPVP